jgi:hypothetical protein
MPKEAKSKDKPARPKPATKAGAGPSAAKGKPAARPSAETRPAAHKKKLARVPEQYIFYCCNGSIFRDMAELAAGLAAMTDDAFAYHSNLEKQDFSNWVRDIIEDIELAEALAVARSRHEAANCVADRIIVLSR